MAAQSDELIHHGVKGMKWGVRRYQNEDGTLTDAGKKKYGTPENYQYKRKISKYATVGLILAGPIGAAIVGMIGRKKYEHLINSPIKDAHAAKDVANVVNSILIGDSTKIDAVTVPKDDTPIPGRKRLSDGTFEIDFDYFKKRPEELQ